MALGLSYEKRSEDRPWKAAVNNSGQRTREQENKRTKTRQDSNCFHKARRAGREVLEMSRGEELDRKRYEFILFHLFRIGRLENEGGIDRRMQIEER